MGSPTSETELVSLMKGTLGFVVLRFCPFFASVFRSFRSSVLWFSTAPQFAVFNPYHRRFTVCRCSWFFGSFITHTLHAALQRYTDITVSVFNYFGHGFLVFGAFCCGFSVFATLTMPPSLILDLVVQRGDKFIPGIVLTQG